MNAAVIAGARLTLLPRFDPGQALRAIADRKITVFEGVPTMYVEMRGGHNVYPREIEEVFYEHPGVAEAAVIGIRHDLLGEEVAAVVALRPDARTDAEELRQFVRHRVAPYKYPREIRLVDALPKGPTGKILKREIGGFWPTAAAPGLRRPRRGCCAGSDAGFDRSCLGLFDLGRRRQPREGDTTAVTARGSSEPAYPEL